MNTKEVLVQAIRAIDEAEVPSDLRQTAFAKAIDLISGSAQSLKSVSRAAEAAKDEPTGSGLDRIASKLGVSSDVVSQLYYVDPDGGLEVIVSPGRLASKASPATKELALLVVAGRQALGLDPEWTAADEIRKVCDNFRKLDSSNFSTTLREMEDVFSFRGSPKQREVRMSRPGWDRTTELAHRLAGTGGNG